MTFSLFTVFLPHIFPFLADFSRCPVPGTKNFLVRKTSLYKNGHNFFSVYDIKIPFPDKSCANTLALIWFLYELKMLTQSKDMAEKQNLYCTWYISLTISIICNIQNFKHVATFSHVCIVAMWFFTFCWDVVPNT